MNLEEVNPEEVMTEDFSDYLSERAELQEALGKLTQEQQMVITLRILKGYSVADTAQLMKKKEGTVRVLQFRAVKALSDLLTAK